MEKMLKNVNNTLIGVNCSIALQRINNYFI
jgi:hypothetical protein